MVSEQAMCGIALTAPAISTPQARQLAFAFDIVSLETNTI